ncbi:SCO3374 family protein [Streptomyces sp. NBC_01477]|uniref:SCO3374 family protein n=1 Tax=Streptomyces sp. NBC_01477 TaxID=2976015 RepID=UPI002E33D6E2|nr:SCO3374 family protein [Streptomyces sp. NBC_01477]
MRRRSCTGMDWYEHELGWPLSGALPPGLVTGVRFDALDVPVAVGYALLSRFARPGRLGPVALDGGRVLLLVAAGAADELPGLLEWLEWGGVPLDVAALGAGQEMRAPAHPEWGRREAAYDRSAPVWLRPPRPGVEVEATLPALRFAGGADGSGVPIGLPALVAALATACHRIALRARTQDQPWAFSYASRIVAGTRPRSLTS